MIITCPHCQTKYQVAFEAIGSAGRKVQCAHCHQAWTQDASATTADPPPGDKLFDSIAEDGLDEAMSAEENAVAIEKAKAAAGRPLEPLPDVNAAEIRKRQMAFLRRQNAMNSSLPLARLRRAARIVGIAMLAGIVGGAWFGRVPIVERYPDLAGLYEAVGLGVNVVGLDFSNLETLKQLSGGNEVLTVSAQIVGRSKTPVPVPPVVISLLDVSGRAIYEWSVQPRVNDLMVGERATFDTRLSLPPSEAVRVRLTFAGRGFKAGNAVVATDALAPGLADTLSLPSNETHVSAAPTDTHITETEAAAHVSPAEPHH